MRISIGGASVALLLGVTGPGLAKETGGDGWVRLDLTRIGRQSYPAYTGIRLIGFSAGGVLWSAWRIHSSRETLHIFRWRNGKVTDLGSLGRLNQVSAVNDRGQIVGAKSYPRSYYPQRGDPPIPPERAFLWQEGRLTSLGTLGGRNSYAAAINQRGQVVGTSNLGTHAGDRPTSHAFLWQGGIMTDLGTLGGDSSGAVAINDRGQVVGTSTTARENHAFLWENGIMTDLGTLGGRMSEAIAINDHGEVIGYSSTPDGARHAFVWQDGKMTQLPTLDLGTLPVACSRNTLVPRCQRPCPPKRPPSCRYWRNEVVAINDRGEVIGVSQTDAGAGRAFLWENGRMTDLGTLGGRDSEAIAINDRGQIVGRSDTRNTASQHYARPRPFLWEGGTITELPTRIATPTGAFAIDERGTQILGSGQYQALLWRPRRDG
jgi:probable HAF family extracellular repeat protein